LPDSLTPLPIVLGPTGAGKSDLALCIAEALPGEIVNYDSLQIYRGFDIGTAKTPVSARRGIPHHLIDIRDPTELFTAGDYSVLARRTLAEIAARGHTPVLVGGTGFYLRSLLEGLFSGPSRSSELRKRLELREERRRGSLHRILTRLDPLSAARIHPSDKNKLIRALEVRLLEGQPVSELLNRGRDPLAGFRPIKIGLNPPRELLYQRLDARSVQLFAQGLIEEVGELLHRGIPPDAKPFESIGYQQGLAVMQNRMTRADALASTQLETRRYAKRQLTWFRKESGVHWLPAFGNDSQTIAQTLAIITAETVMERLQPHSKNSK